ncbi:MAG TPA: type IV pilin protein [Woeseiaceae bacterium]
MKRTRVRGITLIELLIALVIVGILASVAYPAWQSSIRKSRRADGHAALIAVQLAQEKLRSSCRFYAQNLGAGNACGANAAGSTIAAQAASPDGHYTITLSGASATGYTATATAVGDQVKDEAGGVTCTLAITVSAANPNGVRSPADCW